MASSMLTGERRWVSARRGGMTVLGKVTVPKPVNLPSQRSENHGLDPNVEIVPKGTLSWGSRSSSSSNAWGSQALSPPTGGGAGSPLLTSFPSSGGTGSRPSTAGSDRSHEPAPNAWGSSSRPSSASGVFVSNQTSTSTVTRPRSADTRPGSSQLSRFAEPVSENSGAWGTSGRAEKLAHSSSKINAFSLSSGDFPTLGSEKSTELDVQEDHSLQARPVSASGVSARKEKLEILHTDDESVDAKRERGTLNAWKGESSPCGGGTTPSSMEKWQREPHPFQNPNMHPQHFEPWHGSMCPPSEGVWFRPSGGPPYGPPPGPPCNYPGEPFAYYHPHLPARPLANSQALPRPGSGPAPGGYHQRNGNSYLPHMPDSYVRPMMPVRPAVYPGQLPYDGYYGPPHVMCNSGERDAPVMGMATGPCVYGGYQVQKAHPDSGNFHARPSGYGPTNTSMAEEHVEAGHPQGSHLGPYKVLLKQHDGWEGSDDKQKVEQDHPVTTNVRPLERGGRPGTPVKDYASGADRGNVELMELSKKVSVELSSQSADSKGSYSTVPAGLNITENANKIKKVDDGLAKKPEASTITRKGPNPVFSTPTNPIPMDKGLNNKARISADRNVVGHVPPREEKLKPCRVVNANAEHSTNEASRICFPENNSANRVLNSTHDASASAVDKRPEPTLISGTVVSRSGCDSAANPLNSSADEVISQSNIHKGARGVHGRPDYRARGRVNTQEGELWRQKPLVADSSVIVPVKSVETTTNVCFVGQDATQEASAFDPIDYKVQRAKMREIAAERAKQLQKEEEERIREQKAKALAKLEELNKRALAESSTEKLDCTSPLSGAVDQKQESSAGPSSDQSSSAVGLSSTDAGQSSDSVAENNNCRVRGQSELIKNAPLKGSVCPPQDPIVTKNLSLPSPLPQEADMVDFTNQKAASQVNDTFVTKQKQMGYKRKQNNIPLDKNSSDKSIPTGRNGGAKSHGNVVTDANALSGESSFASNTHSTVDDSTPQQKKKNSRSGKNKHKLDEVSSGVPLPSSVPSEGIAANASAEISKPKVSGSVVLEGNLVQSLSSKENSAARDSQDVVLSAEQGWSQPTEEALGSVNNHRKPQAPRRMPRNAQSSRLTVKFHGNDAVWTPVRSLNKNESSDEPIDNAKVEVHIPTTDGTGVQNHQKSRRAEMERYVPKQLSQQGYPQRPSSPSVNKAVSTEITESVEFGSLTTGISGSDGSKVGSADVLKNGENKNGKHGKVQGLWRQRGSFTESPVGHSSQEASSLSSDQRKIVQKPIEQPQSLKPDMLMKGPAKDNDNCNASPSNPISAEPATAPVVLKDHGVANRGKRQSFKSNKVGSHSHNASKRKDHDFSQSDGKTTLVENHATVGDHASSHWQPKSQPYPAHNNNRQGNRTLAGQRVTTQVGKASESDFPAQGSDRNPPILRNGKDNNAAVLVQPHADQSNSGLLNVRQQETKNEQMDVHVKFQTEGPMHSARVVVQENVDSQNDQSFSSGFRKHGQHNGRSGKGGHERDTVIQDNSKQLEQPTDNGRRRNYSHYEYQPTKSYNNEQPNKSFEGGGSSRGMSSRYRRRGGANIYERSGSTVEVAASSGGVNGE